MNNPGGAQLRYPHDAPPAQGQWIEVAGGVYWLQMGLPMALDHINLYVIEDQAGWWIVDTGMKWGDTQQHWQALFDGPMQGKPVVGVICTHLHPDHIGQAGWLCKHWQAPLYMSLGEYLSARTMSQAPSRTEQEDWPLGDHFVRGGIAEDLLQQFANKFRGFGNIVEPLPRSYRRLREGQVLNIGNRAWQVMIGSGHSPEHVCLYDPRDKILLSGDQIIPRITSNVSVMPTEPEANPLVDWFNSLHRFRRDLPADCLVLPAHNAPFYGVHHRLDYLVAHHESHLAAIEKACSTPTTAVELFPVLFQREVGVHEMPLALGEAMAHLHYLYALGRLHRELDEQGAYRYHSVDAEYCPFEQIEEATEPPLQV